MRTGPAFRGCPVLFSCPSGLSRLACVLRPGGRAFGTSASPAVRPRRLVATRMAALDRMLALRSLMVASSWIACFVLACTPADIPSRTETAGSVETAPEDSATAAVEPAAEPPILEIVSDGAPGGGLPQAPAWVEPEAADPGPAAPSAPAGSVSVIEESWPDGKPKLRRSVLHDGDGIVNHGPFSKWHRNGVPAE